MNDNLLQRGQAIKLVVFDVDGVLTDGRLYFLADGSEIKTFSTLDGQGIKMLINASSPRSSPAGPRQWSSAAPAAWVSLTFTRAAKTN
jgi:phosphoglycolate phosphatase-like HAD superfamily hydrolase